MDGAKGLVFDLNHAKELPTSFVGHTFKKGAQSKMVVRNIRVARVEVTGANWHNQAMSLI